MYRIFKIVFISPEVPHVIRHVHFSAHGISKIFWFSIYERDIENKDNYFANLARAAFVNSDNTN